MSYLLKDCQNKEFRSLKKSNHSWDSLHKSHFHQNRQSVRDRLLLGLTSPLRRHFLLPGVSHLVSGHCIASIQLTLSAGEEYYCSKIHLDNSYSSLNNLVMLIQYISLLYLFETYCLKGPHGC